MNCPHCGKKINVGALLGARSSAAKTRAARENAKKGGWPKGRKRGKRIASKMNVETGEAKAHSLHLLVSREWALRLVAKWCENRAAQTADRRLLERCRKAYKKGPMVSPVERFTNALQSEIDENTDFWMSLAKTMRDEAEEIEAANAELSGCGDENQKPI